MTTDKDQPTTNRELLGKRALIVDDHRNIRVTLEMTLVGEGMTVTLCENLALGKEAVGKGPPFDIVLLDLRLPDGSGLDILKVLKDKGWASRAIMISGEGTASDAFLATQLGAFDFVEKPFSPERILVSVARCLEFNHLNAVNESLQQKMLRGQEILGEHPKIKDVQNLVRKVAPTSSRILITGESGTGKELVAKMLHRLSERRDKAFVKVNCAAIPHSLIESELFGHEKGSFTGAIRQRRGLFEQADGGTLLLDEIGELSPDVQAKLLRVLQSGELSRLGSEKVMTVDVRLIAATHRDLQDLVAKGQFREDLFYRLNVVTIKVPPLRHRASDIAFLAQTFLADACDEHSLGDRVFSEEALSQLSRYHWPGNIRELRNLVERQAILTEGEVIEKIDELEGMVDGEAGEGDDPGTLTKVTLPRSAAGKSPVADPEDFSFTTALKPWHDFHQLLDRAYVKFTLRHTEGNVSEAARVLELERAYLHRLMKKLGIHRDVSIE